MILSMNNPTDTNQASEDELDEKLTNIIQSVTLEHPAIGEHTLWDISPPDEQDEWGYILFKQLKSLIRTEKLKLLAEVRERVIGEDLPPDVATDSGMDYSYQQFAINMGKAGQRTKLTKLEAEL